MASPQADPTAKRPRARFGVPASIATRLAMSFGLLCVLMVASVGYGVLQTRSIQREFATALDERVPILAQLRDLARDVNGVGAAARDCLIASDESAAAAALARVADGRVHIGEAIEALQQTLASGGTEAQAHAKELGDRSSSVLVSLLKLTRLRQGGDKETAQRLLFEQVVPRMGEFTTAIDQAQAMAMRQLNQARSDSEATARASMRVEIAVLLAALLAAATLGWIICRSIVRPVDETVRLAERIASGDLTNRPMVAGLGELERLQQAVLRMQEQLRGLVGSIRHSAESIAAASGEIAEGSQDLSERTEQAAGSLQQTARGVDEIADGVRQSTDAATAANALADSTAQSARRGGEVVARVVERMAEISAASNRIGEITGVIDGIAFQTNILALNAAVEAARAGEHGRGFSIVALEVRTLAARSARAASDIKALIEESARRNEAGDRLVKDAGIAMREVVDGIQDVARMVGDICATARSQSVQLADASAALRRLDEMTQRNAALVEESSASALSLRTEAGQLQAAVNQFRVAG